MSHEPTTTTEYAVATQTFVDGEYDRIDDGRGWSDRRGKGYTYDEAIALIERENENQRRRTKNPDAVGALLYTREVTSWTAAPVMKVD